MGAVLLFFPAKDAKRKCHCGSSAPAAEGNASANTSSLDEKRIAVLKVGTEAGVFGCVAAKQVSGPWTSCLGSHAVMQPVQALVSSGRREPGCGLAL